MELAREVFWVFIISPSKWLSLEKNKTVNLKKTSQMLLNFLGGVLIKMKDKRNLMGQDKLDQLIKFSLQTDDRVKEINRLKIQY